MRKYYSEEALFVFAFFGSMVNNSVFAENGSWDVSVWNNADWYLEQDQPGNTDIDTDGDGIGNNTDTDDDGDGVPDTQDAFPLNSSEYLDTDLDGIGNNADTDDDGDGVPDTQDAFPLDATRSTAQYSSCLSSTNNVVSISSSGRSYEIIKEKKTWEQAAACAVARGGYLVHIDDASEQSFIYSSITDYISASYTVVSDGGGIAYVWIGATDKNLEGTWIWDGDNDGNGTKIFQGQGFAGGTSYTTYGKYLNWGRNYYGSGNFYAEPDDYNNNQDAAAIGLEAWPKNSGIYGSAGEWNDINKDNLLYYIIEYDNTDIDTDGDGVPDRQDAFPLNSSEYLDTDRDGIGNNADTDDDEDGITDIDEIKYGLNPLDSSDARDDFDGDGMTNFEEISKGRNPSINEAVIIQIILGQ